MADRDATETSWSLIARAASGDRSARSFFGRTYLPLVREMLALRWRGTMLAGQVDDATQEAFLALFRPFGPLERVDPAKGDFRDYLFGVVRKVAARFEERASLDLRRATTDSTPLLTLADRKARFSRLFDREWARSLMRAAAEFMDERAVDAPARRRVELLRMRFGEGLPIRDIAARWGMDSDAVHRAYACAREEFHACLRAVVARDAVRSEADLDAECRRLFAVLACPE